MSAGRILVVDGDPQIRRAMRATLTPREYEVGDARTGEEAIEKLCAGAYVLLDMNLPGIGGLETCRLIRSGSDTPWYNLTIGLAMLIGRFAVIIPMLAVAGSLAAKKRIPMTSGTLPTHGTLWVGLLVGTIIIVGALTFFPVLSLGPIVEYLLMLQGELF